jgi:restriction endonuclease Mrr
LAIPDFQTVMLPLVKALADAQERTMRELTDLLADLFKLTEQERQAVLPSGQQTIFSNRVAWAKSHLKYAGLLENPTRGLSIRHNYSDGRLLAWKPATSQVRLCNPRHNVLTPGIPSLLRLR